MFTLAISFAADRAGGRRPILIALAWASLASFVLLWASDGFWQMLAASLLLAASWTTILPLVETVAVSGIRRGVLDYGKVRLWGSLSFIVASLGSGLIIGRLGSQAVLPLLIGGAALMVVGAHLVPQALARASHIPSALRRLSLSDAFKLLRAPLFLLFLLVASLIQSSHAVYYSFGSLNWRAQGISDGMIGVLWSVGVLTEVALFAVSGRIIALCGTARLLMFAGIAAVFRWGFMAIDPPLWATALLQAARHELRRGPYRRHPFPHPLRARGSRRHGPRALRRLRRRPRARRGDHRLRPALPHVRWRSLCGHGAASPFGSL